MKKALYLKFKDVNHVVQGVHSNVVNFTDKTISYEIAGDVRRINKQDLLFWSYIDKATYKEYQEKYNMFSKLFDKGLILDNGELLTFDTTENEWLIDHEEIINGDDVREILNI